MNVRKSTISRCSLPRMRVARVLEPAMWIVASSCSGDAQVAPSLPPRSATPVLSTPAPDLASVGAATTRAATVLRSVPRADAPPAGAHASVLPPVPRRSDIMGMPLTNRRFTVDEFHLMADIDTLIRTKQTGRARDQGTSRSWNGSGSCGLYETPVESRQAGERILTELTSRCSALGDRSEPVGRRRKCFSALGTRRYGLGNPCPETQLSEAAAGLAVHA